MTAAAARARRSPVPLRWLALAAAVVAAALLVGPPRPDGDPLDPEAPGPLGARGLVVLLERLGAEVVVTSGAPGAGVDVAVVLVDRLGEARQEEVAAWVAAGGTLVVADPSSPLVPVVVAAGIEDPDADGARCDIPALSGVGQLAVDGVGFRPGPGDRACLGDEASAFVVASPVGDGTVVAVGGAGAFTNERLGDADNAVLVASLLAPRPGTRVVVLERPPVGEGDASLRDLVGDGVEQGLIQLAVAFALYALWRARRLGRPVAEERPVDLAASELVGAVAALWQRGGHRGRAAEALRDDSRRRIAARLGLPVDASPAEVADVAAARTGLDRARLAALLEPSDLPGDAALVALATEAHDIDQELARAR